MRRFLGPQFVRQPDGFFLKLLIVCAHRFTPSFSYILSHLRVFCDCTFIIVVRLYQFMGLPTVLFLTTPDCPDQNNHDHTHKSLALIVIAWYNYHIENDNTNRNWSLLIKPSPVRKVYAIQKFELIQTY
jgi:hypothetical protein